MFGGRFSHSIGFVGIDFGSGGIKMLQVREQGQRLNVVGAAKLDLSLARVAPGAAPGGARADDPPAADSAPQARAILADQIRAAFGGGGFTGRRCVVSLAREDVCLQSIRLPRMPDDELRQSAVWEASQRFGFDRHAMEVDFLRTGATLQSGENREEVILIAASHAAIHARVQPVLDAGLRPVAIDTGFAGLVRTYSRQARREADRNLVRMIVEVGYSGATVLITRGDQIAFCKPIMIGGQHFSRAVAEHLQIDERAAEELRAARIAARQLGAAPGAECGADAATDRAVYEAVRPLMGDLVKEITLCLRYYGVTFRGHPPDRIILTGGDGLEPRLGEMLTQGVKAPVEFDDGLDTLSGLIGQVRTALNRQPGPAACWAVPTGLSLRGIRKSEGRRQRTAAPPVRAAA